MIGETVAARFRIDAKLGEGGMGAVYRATDLTLQRDVALKVILHLDDDRERPVERFLREAKIIAQLSSNPNIVSIFDVGTLRDGSPFIVMEYLRGKPLDVLMSEGTRFARTWILDVGMQIAGALADAHDRGVIHRDLTRSGSSSSSS